MRLVLEGEKLKYPTKERIHPRQWDADKQRAKNSKANIHSLELNVYLDNLYKMAVTAYRDHQHIQEGRPPTLQDIRLAKDRRMNRVSEVKVDLFGFFEKLLSQSQTGVRLNPQTGKPITDNTIRTYVTSLYETHPNWAKFGRLLAELFFSYAQTRAEGFLFFTHEERYIRLLDEHPNIINRIPAYHISSYLGITHPSLSRIRKRIQR